MSLRSRLSCLTFIILIYFLPTTAILLELVSFESRFFFLGASWLSSMALAVLLKIPLRELGLRKGGIRRALWSNGLFSLVCIPLMILGAQFFSPDVSYRPLGGGSVLLILYGLFLGPIQEVVYRGILFSLIEKITFNRYLMIGLSTFAYWFMHFIYNNAFMILVTLVAGLFWGISYSRTRNLIGVSLSHTTLGLTAIYLNLI